MRNLLLDIETAPNTAYVWGTFKQNIGLNQIIETGRVLCLAYKWLGDDETHFLAEWQAGGRQQFLTEIARVLDEADVVTTYNGKKFDIPTLNKELLTEGILPPSPYKQIDLYQIVRSTFRFTSNKLDHVAEQLGIGNKVKHEGFELWIKVMAGDAEARERMREYNLQDVDLMVPLYHKLRPWIRNHPNAALFAEDHRDTETLRCKTCGGHHLVKRGYAYTQLGKFQRYRCEDCGSWSRGRENLTSKEQRQTFTTQIVG